MLCLTQEAIAELESLLQPTRFRDYCPNGLQVPGGSDMEKVATGVTASAELFDPTSGTWTATGSMSLPRTSHTATLLQTGQVLIAGGEATAGNPGASTELYDPASGLFTIAATPLASPRVAHTATRLPDGRVLLVGGNAAGTTAEIRR